MKVQQNYYSFKTKNSLVAAKLSTRLIAGVLRVARCLWLKNK